MRLFISSPQIGLKEVREGILKNESKLGITFSAMESFFSSPNTPKSECLEHLRKSDYVILLIGPEYGSIDPETGKSFTEVEYDEASQLGIGIFPYIYSKSVGEWQPQDKDEELKEKHKKFVEKVKKGTLRAFQSVDALINEITPAIEFYKERLSKPYSPLVDYRDYFDLFLGKQERLFRHDYRFIGREKEMGIIGDFLKSSKKVLTISGRGGIGKSKLIYEAAKQNEITTEGWKRFLFIKENVSFDNEILKKIPSGHTVLVLEDAHRNSQQLSNVLAVFKNRDLVDRLKLIITLRPSGSEIVQMSLSRSLDSTLIEEMPEIKAIGIKETEIIVSGFLQNDSVVIRQVAAMTKESPLITIIGSRLIVDKKIRILKNDVQFRKIILDKFLEEFVPLSKDRILNKLLQYIAALSPIRPDDQHLINALSQSLKIEKDEVAAKLVEFENAGLLLRIGGLVKIVPDLVSDHILYQVCVLKGVSTPFPKRVYAEFPHEYASNLLRNVAELEWRIQSDNKRISLLIEVWEDIYKQFKDSTNYGRLHLLGHIEKAAIFQPHQALKLVEFAINNPSKVKKEKRITLKGMPSWTHDEVLRKLPDILRSISVHQDCLRKTCELLWELGKADKRELNSHPDHAIRVLSDIVGYKNPYQLVTTKKCIVEFLEDLILRPDFYKYKDAMFPIIDAILRKEGELRFSEPGGFTIQPYILNGKALLPLRSRAVRILGKMFLQQKHASAITKAYSSLVKALHYITGSFGRVISKEEEDQWLPEQIEILGILKTGLDKNKATSLRILVKKEMEWFSNHARHDETKDLAKRILGMIDMEDYSYCLYRSVMGDFSEFWGTEIEIDNRQKLFEDRLNSMAVEFKQKVKTAQGVEKKLESVLGELNAYGLNPKANFLIAKIAQTDSKLAISLYSSVLKKPKSVLAIYSSNLLWPLRGVIPDTNFDKLVKNGIATKDKEIISNILHSYAWGGFVSALNTSDISNLKTILSLNLNDLMPNLLTVITNLGKFKPEVAKGFLLAMPVESGWSERFCGSVNTAYGVPFSCFTRSDLSKMLKKLTKINLFKGEHFRTEEFLKQIGNTYPDLLISFLLKRLKFSYSNASKDLEYVPFPYLGFNDDLIDFNKLTGHEKLIRQLRSTTLYGRDTFWLPKLFQTISGNYNDFSLQILSEWLNSRNLKKLTGLSLLLREADEHILCDKYKFIGELIKEASLTSSECLRRVKSDLFSIAVGVERKYGPGEPPPKLVSLKESSIKTSEFFDATHPARLFYQDIATYAENTIKDDLERDEELSYGL